ncbi:MAG: efflux transporter outer membrane subunit [Deltaproteobacteria bacterium]|jgi:multidrug efflux system outer membrane protein|nr:efflux transporter outer membrane subunit [Deltaproteobacteria bacterium]
MLGLPIIAMIAGCMIGPDYERPTLDNPPSWRVDAKDAADLSNSPWWKQFEDPELLLLIDEALRENKDLLIATARVDEFLGRYGVARADLFPQVGAEGAAARDRFSEDITPPGPGVSNPDEIYQAFLTATWEVDLWGRLRRATEVARADLLSTEEARQIVIQTLVSSVALGYIDLLSLDRQLQISIETAETRKKALNIFTKRHQAGVISNLELSQVKSEYQAAKTRIPELKRAIGRRENALSVLLGRNPGSIKRGGTIADLKLPTVPAGLPSELLTRRPDIRQAEQDLIAANARIGVARAAYFPTVSLTGFLGTSSRDVSALFEGSSKTWNYAGNITVPIFTAGRIRGEVAVAEAVQQQNLVKYQQSVQNAFREVDDALVDQEYLRETLVAQHERVLALKDYARLARLRYDEGYSSYLEVLDAERSLFNSDLAYTQTQADLFNALVNLYKAMGGGWIDLADEMTY